MNNEQEQNNKRKTWDLMIGIAMVTFGPLRLYNRLQTEESLSFRSGIIIASIVFGGYLILRYFKNR